MGSGASRASDDAAFADTGDQRRLASFGAKTALSPEKRRKMLKSKRMQQHMARFDSLGAGKFFVDPKKAAALQQKSADESLRQQILQAERVCKHNHQPVHDFDIKLKYQLDRGAAGELLRLGEGSCCTVFRATRLTDNRKFAVKRIRWMAKRKVVTTELSCLRRANHPHIVRMQEAFLVDQEDILFVLENLPGGDLFDALRGVGHFEEAQAARLLRQMVGAVSYLHSKQIVHRDLKLENWVFRDQACNDIVLIDFGLSHVLEAPSERMHDCLGTSYYVSPETIAKDYGIECDMWSLGVISYMLVSGKTPFGGGSDGEILRRIVETVPAFASPVWDLVSDDATTFVLGLLNKDPDERCTAFEALRHPWIRRYAPRYSEEQRTDATQQLVSAMTRFNAYSGIKRLVHAIVAHGTEHAQMDEANKLFDVLDVDENGKIAFENIRRYVPTEAQQAIEEGFQGLDTAEEGHIERDAFVATFLGPEHITNDALKTAFAIIVRSADSRLDRNALQTFLGDTYASIEVSTLLQEANAALSATKPLVDADLKASDISLSLADFIAVTTVDEQSPPCA